MDEFIIEDEETCAMAEELAQLTGEDVIEAITKAVRERLERISPPELGATDEAK